MKHTRVRRSIRLTVSLALTLLVTAGCAAGRQAYKRGIEAELVRDYEEALTQYQEALSENPGEIEYRLKVEQSRFNAAFEHFENGRRALDAGEPDAAALEFTRALELDPTHDLARVELERTEALIQAGVEVTEIPSAREEFETRKELARTDPSMDLQLSPNIRRPYLTADHTGGPGHL